MDEPIRGRCALCRCRATSRVFGIKVCDYHVTHGESDRACPYCYHGALLFDPRWTYTTTGRMMSKLVERRQVNFPNTVYLDKHGEAVLCVESVSEQAPREWKTANRQSVVMLGIGVQMGTTFTVTQWASDYERELFDAFIPTVALCHRIFVLGMNDVHRLAGGKSKNRMQKVPWPTMNVRPKAVNVAPILLQQGIPACLRPEDDLHPNKVPNYWATPNRQMRAERREQVWLHNYRNVMDLAKRVFQVEW